MPIFVGITPITANSTVNINTPRNNIDGFIIGNESGYTCVIQLVGTSFTKSLYPGTVDYFKSSPQFTGVLAIQTFNYLSNSASYPGSFLQIDAVYTGEQLPYFFPMSLSRVQNVGNTINTFSSSSSNTDTSLANDTSSAGTQFIEATVSGDAGSAVNVTVDGIWTIGNSTHTGKFSSDNAVFTSDGGGNIVTNALTVNGNLNATSLTMVNGTNTFTNGSKSPIITSYKVFQFTTNGTSNQMITHSLGITPVNVLMTRYTGSGANNSLPGLVSFDSTTATFYSVGMGSTIVLCCVIG